MLQLSIIPHRNDDKCPAIPINVHMQYGSVPLFNITNKTFPTDQGYYLHRTGYRHLTVTSDGPKLLYNLTLPKPGSWFVSLYVETPTDKKVKKKTDKCDYKLGLHAVSEFLRSAYELQSQQHVVLNALEKKYLRFWVSGQTWMYNLSISLANPTNQSDAHIQVSFRPLNQSDGITKEACRLTASEKCGFEQLSPFVEDWVFVMLKNKENATLKLDVKLGLQECGLSPFARVYVSQSNNTASDRTTTEVTSPMHEHLTTVGLPYMSTEDQMTRNSSGEDNIHANKGVSMVTKMPSRTTIRSDRAPTLHTLPVNHSVSPWQPLVIGRSQAECLYPITLLRKENPTNQFDTHFFGQGAFLPVFDFETLVFRMDLHSLTDVGSNLHMDLTLKPPKQNASFTHTEVSLCIQKWRVPVNGSRLHCSNPGRDLIELTASDREDKVSRIYPYPEAGPWYIGLQAVCYNKTGNTSTLIPCFGQVGVDFTARVGGCVACKNDGYCTEATAASRSVVYCQCRARYSGYTCSDDSNAKSLFTQKTYTLLLTCSNLFFIPGIILAVYRRYFVEALVYFANMFFSAFYHSCDMGGWSVYRMCILPYHVLSYCDFFLSIMSFWVTFIAIANPPTAAKSVCHMTGAIALAMAVEWHSHGLLTNLIPICVGGGVVIISWIVRCIRFKEFYPKKKAFLIMLPGILLAGGGIATFELTETDDNYPYTHSMWHMCISLSILFLLPLRKQKSDCADASSLSSDHMELSPDLRSRSDVPLLNPASSVAYCDDSDDDPKLEL